jgi:hypothetical protein
MLTICTLPFAIASIVVAHDDWDNTCQGQDRSGIDLDVWLLTHGIVTLSFVVGAYIVSTLVCIYDGISAFWTRIVSVYTIFIMFFLVAWDILGAIILERSHSECLKSRQGLGILSLILLILAALSALSSICSRHRSN